jgi:hypothetical protein
VGLVDAASSHPGTATSSCEPSMSTGSRPIATAFHGEYLVTLRDGTKLTSGRSYRSGLRDIMGKTR